MTSWNDETDFENETASAEETNQKTDEITTSVEKTTDPLNAVQKLDPFELERFCRLEAEIKLCNQGMRIVDLELLEIKRALQNKSNEASQRRRYLEMELKGKWKLQYDDLLMTIAAKYGISDPAHMLIDIDVGTIRDASV